MGRLRTMEEGRTPCGEPWVDGSPGSVPRRSYLLIPTVDRMDSVMWRVARRASPPPSAGKRRRTTTSSAAQPAPARRNRSCPVRAASPPRIAAPAAPAPGHAGPVPPPSQDRSTCVELNTGRRGAVYIGRAPPRAHYFEVTSNSDAVAGAAAHRAATATADELECAWLNRNI